MPAVQLMENYCLSSLLSACQMCLWEHAILIWQRWHIITLSEGAMIAAERKPMNSAILHKLVVSVVHCWSEAYFV